MAYINGQYVAFSPSVVITNGYTEKDLANAFSNGQKTEYDHFWDNAQHYGNLTDYQFAFGGLTWNDETFKPKYSLRPENARNMFVNTRISDLAKRLEESGVVLDTSNCSACDRMFYLSLITNAPTLVLTKVSNLNNICHSAYKLETIHLVISDSGEQTFTDSFYKANTLTNFTFEGVIGQSIDFSYSPLSRASIKNVINHLSETSVGKSVTFNLAAVISAFGTTSSIGWSNLEASKPNWNIILV